MDGFDLTLLAERYAVSRLPPGSAVAALTGGALSAIIHTAHETSLVTTEAEAPAGGAAAGSSRVERGFRAFEVAGPLAFETVGVLAALTAALAAAGVGVFALSTFDTDYLLVREADLPRAVAALSGAGHRVTA